MIEQLIVKALQATITCFFAKETLNVLESFPKECCSPTQGLQAFANVPFSWGWHR